MFGDFSSAQPLQLVQTPFYDNDQFLFLALREEGGVSGYYWTASKTYSGPVDFSTFPDSSNFNVSAIASGTDPTIYGVYNDSVVQFTIDLHSFNVTHFVEVVYP